MLTVLRTNGETWLICGGRDFSDEALFKEAMGDLMAHFGHPSHIVHGAARGADCMADDLGKRLSVDVTRYSADWQKHGRAAGPIRNAEMLLYNPAKVIAFPGGRGTKDMVVKAQSAGIEVVEIKPCCKPADLIPEATA